MLVVKVELWSAVTGKVSELGRMYLANDGSLHGSRGSYDIKVARRGSKQPQSIRQFKGWGSIKTTRTGRVENYPRASYNVWRLITRALKSAFPEEAK